VKQDVVKVPLWVFLGKECLKQDQQKVFKDDAQNEDCSGCGDSVYFHLLKMQQADKHAVISCLL